MPDPRLGYPLHLPALNKAIGERVREVRGDKVIQVNRTDDAVTVRLNLTALAPLISRPWGLFKLVASATKPGMYTAHPLNPGVQPNPGSSSNLADTDFGVVDTNTTVYLKNVREVGVSGHALSTSNTPDLIFGFYDGCHTDGKPIFTIDECQ